MKKGVLLFFIFTIFILTSCASVKILTPGAIDVDIAGLDNLANCQYFISKDVILKFLSDNRQTGINDRSGIVEAERVIKRSVIKIASSTPGILQTKNNAGDPVHGYKVWISNSEEVMLTLYILFEDDDDNSIGFTAYYDIENDMFELAINEVNYGGLTYTITYDGEEKPYLKYKLLERTRKENEERKAKGRRVGS